MFDGKFYKDKRVFVTGHTGFKGTWLCQMLANYGSWVTGFGLEPPTYPNLFLMSKIDSRINSIIGDIRDLDSLKAAFMQAKPEIVIHLAAQPLVRVGFQNPVLTFETNVIGTVNLLECVRQSSSVRSFVNVTTDKVYENHEWEWGYREIDVLNGSDPYSNSKSCSELVTQSYQRSFFLDRGMAVSTVRAGNVIGGGDFAENRIIPDCIRAASNYRTIIVRNPDSVRPYQHVLESLSAYLQIAEAQFHDTKVAGSYNVGPDGCDCVATGELVSLFCRHWGDNASWKHIPDDSFHEADSLKLDSAKIRRIIGWRPRWHIEDALIRTCSFAKLMSGGSDVQHLMDEQISEYCSV